VKTLLKGMRPPVNSPATILITPSQPPSRVSPGKADHRFSLSRERLRQQDHGKQQVKDIPCLEQAFEREHDDSQKTRTKELEGRSNRVVA
jgi:hypothetical protein